MPQAAASRRIEVAEPLQRLFAPKRIKVAIGGRGAGKSVGFADAFLGYADGGQRLCCAREHQNTIEDSVHALLQGRILEKGLEDDFQVSANRIDSRTGGEIFYRGLARNVEGFKSTYGIRKLWIEEGQKLSEHTIITVFPTIRAAESEIWISANRGASNDAFSRLILKEAEDDLARQGWYESEEMIVVQINFWDNPWFPDELEQQRLRDKRNMPAALYDHVWNGAYSDSIEDAIIEPDWFDACVDAHKTLNFKASGIEVIGFDPFDGGEDAAAIAHRHGSVIVHVDESKNGRVNDCCDWALDYTQQAKPDAFIWDADGVGAGLKRQITDALGSKKIDVHSFNGGMSVHNPKGQYDPTPGMVMKAKNNQETFYNRRAQRYWNLRDRIYRTYLAVQDGQYTDPGELISFDSSIEALNVLRSELCRIPRKMGGTGKIQLRTKQEMMDMGISSPNMADAVMMTMDVEAIKAQRAKPKFQGWN